ncbi:A disintegrin and metalloproteinase with thrombospondin motifs 6 [Channa argus]|uniref:A disintegrin and metalloproteinase with thrombospondin motifs 6 n=1 Tax=Channa argus TaxID=215402 RepID=A0A6G1PKD1_CHAAH|nr:A disintegrin and metalloproteinase with thrombospondin motifs 6 [Channa argus]
MEERRGGWGEVGERDMSELGGQTLLEDSKGWVLADTAMQSQETRVKEKGTHENNVTPDLGSVTMETLWRTGLVCTVIVIMAATEVAGGHRAEFAQSQAAFLSSLGQYEIAIPVRVQPNGETLDAETPQPNRRRRSTEDRLPDSLFYQLSTSRNNFLLNLTLQGGLLSQQFRVEYWKRGRLAWSQPYSPHCHYVGHLQDQPHSSKVALSNCNGLSRSSSRMVPQFAVIGFFERDRLRVGHWKYSAVQ